MTDGQYCTVGADGTTLEKKTGIPGESEENYIYLKDGVLTLKNFNYKSPDKTSVPTVAIHITGGDCTIVMEGSSTVTAGDTTGYFHESSAISSTHDLTFIGNGTLNAIGGAATSTSSGVRREIGVVTISSGTLNAKGGKADYVLSSGIYSDAVEVKGGKLNATSDITSADSYGVYLYGAVTVSGNGTLLSLSKINKDPTGNGNYLYQQADGNWMVKGKVTLSAGTNLTIDEGKTMTVENGATLNIENGATLTNNGTFTVAKDATLTNKGAIVNNGSFSAPHLTRSQLGSISGSGDVSIKADPTPAPTPSPVVFETVVRTTFADVPENHWATEDIKKVVLRGNFRGDTMGNFNPDAEMIRNDMLTVLMRMKGNIFSDESQQLAWAVSAGITDGTDMDKGTTREHFVTMLWRMLDKPSSAGSYAGFSDANSVSDWANDAMAWAVENGIITGMGDNTIIPKTVCTRAQIAAMLNRVYDKSLA